MARYYVGVDWGDQSHGVWACDDTGRGLWDRMVPHTLGGLSEFRRWLHEARAAGVEVWAAIEKPHGRLVDFLLDCGVVVYPVNPKTLDRARDRFRVSSSKSDRFDARVLAEFLRTDHPHLHPLRPGSAAAQELKLLTRDYQRLVRHQTRLVNQLIVALKEYYPRPVEVFSDLTSPLALAFLRAAPTPEALASLHRTQWQRLAKAHRLGEARTTALWEQLKAPQLPVPPHVVRAKARLVAVLVAQLEPLHAAVVEYRAEVERFFAGLPVAPWAKTLPAAKSGVTVPAIFAELGDEPSRWQSFRHLQAEGGTVPVTQRSGQRCVVHFRFGCNKPLRQAITWLAFHSVRQSPWAKAYYQQQRARGRRHHQALRALGAKWLKIIFMMWKHQTPYNEQAHLANMTRQRLRATA